MSALEEVVVHRVDVVLPVVLEGLDEGSVDWLCSARCDARCAGGGGEGAQLPPCFWTRTRPRDGKAQSHEVTSTVAARRLGTDGSMIHFSLVNYME